ncbi:hypothetical protein AGMMS49921_09570 [Endomicrobiia bacterium]|nr:hypothetical protein AGMMS49921_09570 [Endomicrobiia bacterium]
MTHIEFTAIIIAKIRNLFLPLKPDTENRRVKYNTICTIEGFATEITINLGFPKTLVTNKIKLRIIEWTVEHIVAIY